MRRYVAVTLLILSVCLSTQAQSEEVPDPGWFVPVGLNTGLGVVGGSPSFLLGAEVSAVYLGEALWGGFYGDALYDFSQAQQRLSVGSEFGWLFLGAELGGVAIIGEARDIYGLRVGGLLTNGFSTAYLRWIGLGHENQEDIFEAGLLFKWPFMIADVPK